MFEEELGIEPSVYGMVAQDGSQSYFSREVVDMATDGDVRSAVVNALLVKGFEAKTIFAHYDLDRESLNPVTSSSVFHALVAGAKNPKIVMHYWIDGDTLYQCKIVYWYRSY